jgi:hypothetical protein
VTWIRLLRKVLYLQAQKRRLIILDLNTIDLSHAGVVTSWSGSQGQPREYRQPYHLNATGSFYSVKDCCIICLAPESVAPDLMRLYEDPSGTNRMSHCFFTRQPETAEEIDHAIAAMNISCVQNLRYAGDDPEILKRLCELGCGDLCDAFDQN